MIGDYKGRELLAVGEAFDVSPENIENRTTRSRLSSGIKVALLPKATRGSTVHLRLTLRHGSLETLSGRGKDSEFLPVLMTRGTRNMTRQQIKDELDRQLSQMSTSSAPGSATFTVKTKRKNLIPTLNILRQILREPVFPENELELIKQAHVAQLEQQLNEPRTLAVTHVNRNVNPYSRNDPRYIPTVAEEIELVKVVTASRIRSLYEELVCGQSGELTLVGDFDPDEVIPVCSEMLADWESTHAYARIGKTGDVKLNRSFTEISTPDKANAMLFAGSVFPMRDDDPRYPAALMGNFILGGGSLSSRLADRVRQDEGLSYGVGSGLRASALDERTTFYIFAICNPENMTRLRDVISEEITRIREDGVTAEELKNARIGFLKRLEVSRTNDATLTSLLEKTTVADRTMQFSAKLETSIRGLTVEQVNAAIRRYIDPERFVIAAAGDFDAVAAQAGQNGGPTD